MLKWLRRFFAFPEAKDLYRGQAVKLYDGRMVKVTHPSPRGTHSGVFEADDDHVYSREDIAR
jgi:hypothetical protein